MLENTATSLSAQIETNDETETHTEKKSKRALIAGFAAAAVLFGSICTLLKLQAKENLTRYHQELSEAREQVKIPVLAVQEVKDGKLVFVGIVSRVLDDDKDMLSATVEDEYTDNGRGKITFKDFCTGMTYTTTLGKTHRFPNGIKCEDLPKVENASSSGQVAPRSQGRLAAQIDPPHDSTQPTVPSSSNGSTAVSLTLE